MITHVSKITGQQQDGVHLAARRGLEHIAAAVATLQGGRLCARPGAEDGRALGAEACHGRVAVPAGRVPGRDVRMPRVP